MIAKIERYISAEYIKTLENGLEEHTVSGIIKHTLFDAIDKERKNGEMVFRSRIGYEPTMTCIYRLPDGCIKIEITDG